MTDCVVGVDPGLTGGLAILDGDAQLVTLADLPICRTPGKLAWIDGGQLETLLGETLQIRSAVAVVELASAMPKQGVSSTFAFGVAFGSILSVLQAWELPIHLVPPSKWKRELQLTGKDKNASLYKARLLYPKADLKLAKHHGRAEALLIAYWYLHWAKKNPAEAGSERVALASL